jgi:hypothetical protein
MLPGIARRCVCGGRMAQDEAPQIKYRDTHIIPPTGTPTVPSAEPSKEEQALAPATRRHRFPRQPRYDDVPAEGSSAIVQ